MTTLIVAEAMSRLHRDPLPFFQEAYLWKYGKYWDCMADFRRWIVTKDPPKYAVQYAEELLKGELKSAL